MLEQSNKYLCPDCERTYIDSNRYHNFGKCVSCQRRERLALTKNVDYIKFKDLPEDEKKRLDKQRETNNNWRKNRTVGENGSSETNSGETNVRNFLIYKGYLNCSYVSMPSTELYNEYTNYCNTHSSEILSRIEFYKVLREKFGFVKKMRDGVNYYDLGKKSESIKISKTKMPPVNNKQNSDINECENKKLRCNQIYTSEMIDVIRALARPTISVGELREMVKSRYPDKDIKVSNFSNIISRYNIPHLKGRNSRKTNVSEELVTQEELVSLNTDKAMIAPINLGEISNQKENPKQEELDIDGEPIRLVPIKEEVCKVLMTKFNAMHCKTAVDIDLPAYAKLLEMLQYLAQNIDELIKMRNNQYDIINMYQDDLLHEMENELAEAGNTYLSDKAYVIRGYRRFVESDRDALKQMKTLFLELKNVLKDDKVKKVIGQLNYISKNNKSPKFIPTVDLGLIDKYDWAITGSQYSPKNNRAVCVTNDIEKYINTKSDELVEVTLKQSENKLKNTTIRLSPEEISRGFGIYRVSCKLSGGGYGAFKPWYKDYPCVKEEIALSFAQQEFARMKAAQKGLLITELEVHKINI